MPASWGIDRTKIVARVKDDGSAEVRVPLTDGGKPQGTLVLLMSADRKLLVQWEQTPGAQGLTDFRAWWKEG